LNVKLGIVSFPVEEYLVHIWINRVFLFTEHLSHSKYTELYIYKLQLLITFVLLLQQMHFSFMKPSSVSFSNIYMNDLPVLPICY
jgi:Zn-dependent protease